MFFSKALHCLNHYTGLDLLNRFAENSSDVIDELIFIIKSLIGNSIPADKIKNSILDAASKLQEKFGTNYWKALLYIECASNKEIYDTIISNALWSAKSEPKAIDLIDYKYIGEFLTEHFSGHSTEKMKAKRNITLSRVGHWVDVEWRLPLRLSTEGNLIFLKERSLPSALYCSSNGFTTKRKGTAYGWSIVSCFVCKPFFYTL